MTDVLIYPASELLTTFNIPSTGKLRHEYYAAESLSCGSLINHDYYSVVGLTDLYRAGLKTCFPEFFGAQEWHKLFNRVKGLRRIFSNTKTELSESSMNDLLRLGQKFGPKCMVVMTVVFESIRHLNECPRLQLYSRGEIADGYGSGEAYFKLASVPDGLTAVRSFYATLNDAIQDALSKDDTTKVAASRHIDQLQEGFSRLDGRSAR